MTEQRTLIIVGAIALLLIPASVVVAPVCAEEPTDVSEDKSQEQETEPALEERVKVLAHAPTIESETLDAEVLDAGRFINLAEAFETVPGVAGVRRSQDGVEPVVHGLGWERVQTELNGVPLYGACPGRMDPPASIISPALTSRATVFRGLASVSLGPAGTGGRLVVSSYDDRGAAAGREVDGWVNLTYDDARDGYTAGAGVSGGTQHVDFSAGFDLVELNDYASPSGTVVPANIEETSGFLSFGHRPSETQRWNVGAVQQNADHIDYPSLPMDTDDSDSKIFNAAYGFRAANGGVFSEIEARLGRADIEHLMSNRNKSNRGMVETEARSTAETSSAGVGARWVFSERSALHAGSDFVALDRDALRQRHMVMADKTAWDHLWPDVSQDDLGLFAEYLFVPGPAWQLRFGGRYDAVASKAGAADDPGFGGLTIRENYVRFYGPEAAITDRDEGLFSGNLLVTRELGSKVTLQAGLGLVSRAASMSERYYSFAPAPNGFVVGNPALDAEQKREFSLGTTVQGSRFKGSFSVYYYSFADYIYTTILEEEDVNGDGNDDIVRGFYNVDATFYGTDLSVVIEATDRLSLPMSLAYVRAQNDDNNTPLPEIPPLAGRLAARYSFDGRHPAWVELGGRFVDRQDRVDLSFGEDPTPGYAVWHLRGLVRFSEVVELQVGVENLFDKEYHDHLTREVAVAVGDLAKGDEIPAMGRAVVVSTRFMF